MAELMGIIGFLIFIGIICWIWEKLCDLFHWITGYRFWSPDKEIKRKIYEEHFRKERAKERWERTRRKKGL